MLELIFKYMLLNHTADIVNETEFTALINDYFSEYDKEKNLLLLTYSLGIVDDIQNSPSISKDFMNKHVAQLTDEYGLSQENADWIISMWCINYGVNVLGKDCELSIKIAENDQENQDNDDSAKDNCGNIVYAMGMEMDDTPRVLDINIEEMAFSVRAYNTLKRAGINTLEELTCKTSEDIMKMRNMSRKTMIEILEKLQEYEYDLSPEFDCEEIIVRNHPGKRKCDQLRELRQKIALANNIEFEPAKCYHSDPCQGTCPLCDEEIKYIDEELQKKLNRGEKVILTGLGEHDFLKKQQE